MAFVEYGSVDAADVTFAVVGAADVDEIVNVGAVDVGLEVFESTMVGGAVVGDKLIGDTAVEDAVAESTMLGGEVIEDTVVGDEVEDESVIMAKFHMLKFCILTLLAVG